MSLLNLLSNYEYGLSQHGAWVKTSPDTADFLRKCFFKELLTTAQKLNGVFEIINDLHTYKIYPWMNGVEEMANTIWFGDIGVSRSLIQLVERELFERPRSAGIVRLSDERQIILHDESTCTLKFSGLDEATNWRREQYWHRQDLLDFRRLCQQLLEPNNPQSIIEHTYRAKEPKEGASWLRVTNRFQLFDAGDGDTYQLFENLEFMEISPPTDLV